MVLYLLGFRFRLILLNDTFFFFIVFQPIDPPIFDNFPVLRLTFICLFFIARLRNSLFFNILNIVGCMSFLGSFLENDMQTPPSQKKMQNTCRNSFPNLRKKNVDKIFSFTQISLKLGFLSVSEDYFANVCRNFFYFISFSVFLESSEMHFELVTSEIKVKMFLFLHKQC